MKLSIVVPCYNEGQTVNKFYAAIVPALSALTEDYEIIFVNDGSKDDTRDLLKSLALTDDKVKVISFSKNFGQQAAILAGLKASTGDAVIPMDCDLQDPVEVIASMVEKWQQGYQVVHGRRISRAGESGFKKITAKVYYKFLNKISGNVIPKDTGDFKLLDRKVVDAVASMREHNKYLRGLESWVGFKQTFVDFERKERVAGKTNYTLKKMLKLSGDGIFSNSDFPLKLFFRMGVMLTALSTIGAIALIFLQIFLSRLDPAWWALCACGFIGGLTMMQKGVSDMYLYRIYEEEKDRPEYIVDEKINL